MTGSAPKSKGKKIGIYVGRVAVRASGNFKIKTQFVQGINHRYCEVVQRTDGYGYDIVTLLSLAKRNSLVAIAIRKLELTR